MRVRSKSRILHRRDLALELAPGAKRQAWHQRDADDPFHVVGEPQKIADVVAAALGFVKEIAGRRVAVGRSECENLVFGDGGDELVSLTVDSGLDQLVLQLRCVHHGAPTSSGLLRSLGKVWSLAGTGLPSSSILHEIVTKSRAMCCSPAQIEASAGEG